MPLAHRSNSTSIPSTKHPSTPVEIYPRLIETKGSTFAATYEVPTFLPPKSNLISQLLKMFCIKWPEVSECGSQIDSHTSAWPSPWILPVHVVSNRQDNDRHQITNIAKCIIDTGNLQGNVVSRDFAENVLGFPFTSFEKLTGKEENGGTSITGNSHIPLGAIHLTWYHSSSTRVFRNMRFLISPAPHCDMIIGAQSIEKEKILSVPCLMGVQRDAHFTRDKNQQTKEERMLISIQNHLDTVLGKKSKYGRENGGPGTIVAGLENESQVVGWILQLCEFAPHGLDDPSKEEEKVWDNIKSHYPKISKNLSQRLKPTLEVLRSHLGYKDAKNPWTEPAPPHEWSDDIDYEELLKSFK